VLPEGQRLLLGQLAEGATVDVALWRKFIMAQTFSNRILVAATGNGIAAFQPRPGTAVTPRAETIYRDSKQEKNVQDILNSISEEPIKPAIPVVASVAVSPPYIEVEEDAAEAIPEVEEGEEVSAQDEEIKAKTQVQLAKAQETVANTAFIKKKMDDIDTDNMFEALAASRNKLRAVEID
jgi:hypothetical protein